MTNTTSNPAETTTNNKTPKLRFKGFAGEWVQNKFGDLVLIQRGGSPRPIEAFLTQSADGINWVKIGDVSPGSRYINKTKEKIKPEGVNSSRQVFKGDLILSNSMSFGRPYIMNIDGCIHDGWLLIRNDKNIFDLEFLLQLLSSEKMLSQYRELASGGVVNNLNSALVQSTIMVYPKKAEQQKIGSFFQQLDTNLAQHQTQLEKLKNLKQAMLHKMFPQNGATEPEIRFKGFEGDWKNKNFGDVFEYERPDNYIVTSSDYSDKYKTPVLTANKAFILGYTNEDNVYSNQCIIFDDFTLDSKYVDFPFMVKSSALKILTIRDKGLDDLYFSHYLLTQAKIEIMGHARHYISVVQPTKVLTTSLEEQQKIANYFHKLDQLITLQTTQLKKLKQIKQACLTGMFV